MAADPVASMTMDPGGFYVVPVAAQIPSSVPAVPPPMRDSAPASRPIVERFSGDPFATPVAFRPDTDRFILPPPAPALANYLAASSVPGSQYAAAVVPSGVPGYRSGNGISRVVPAVPVRNVDYPRAD